MNIKIKEVNGVKVIHRYSAGAIFTGLFCLLLAGIPCCLLFLPFMKAVDGDVTTLFNYKTLIKFAFLMTNKYDTSAFINFAGQYSSIAKWLLFASGALFLLQLLVALFLVIFAIELICFGTMKHYRFPKGGAGWMFAFTFIQTILSVAYMIVINYVIKTVTISIWTQYIQIGISLVGLIVISIIYHRAFEDRIYINNVNDLKLISDSPVVTSSTSSINSNNVRVNNVEDIRRVKYIAPNGLPSMISNIGGHAFSENQNLKFAVIPYGIPSIGSSAFANCLNLKVVSIPQSVKNIGYNAFFNCVSLERINFGGTIQQWRHVKRGSNWLLKAGTTIVTCADGSIFVNPYH